MSHLSDGTCAAEPVDDDVGFGLHVDRYAIIGSLPQAKTSDIRDCDNRNSVCNATMTELPELKGVAAEIFERLDALGLTQRELASVLGIEENKISNARRGVRQIKGDEATTALAWLGRKEAERAGGTSGGGVAIIELSDNNTVEVIKLDMSLAMGDGTNIEDYVEETSWRFDMNFIRSFTRTPPHRIRIATGVGDSMFPTILSSDAIFFDTTQTRLNLQDKIWACSIRGGGAIKRLRIGPNRKIIVLSDNPAVPDDEVDEDELRIFGRVLRLMRDI